MDNIQFVNAINLILKVIRIFGSQAMRFPIYQIDAFTSQLFKGSPAAVCVLDEWLDDKSLQSVAVENNHSETAFLVKGNAGFAIRWFTPLTEVALCGHATLASSFVVFK